MQKLRARVVFSPSQVDLRTGVPTRSRSDARKEGRGRGKRRERPLSQTSAPATAPADQPHHHPKTKAKGKTHRKSRSMTTATEDTKDLLAAAAVPQLTSQDAPGLDMMTSSGADTSSLACSRSSSSSTVSITSPFDSPSPPVSPLIKATQGRPLYFSASTPSTPSDNHHGDPTPRSKSPRSNAKDPSTVSPVFLSMTPKQSIKSRCKRLFRPPLIAARPKSPNDGGTTLLHRSQSEQS